MHDQSPKMGVWDRYTHSSYIKMRFNGSFLFVAGSARIDLDRTCLIILLMTCCCFPALGGCAEVHPHHRQRCQAGVWSKGAQVTSPSVPTAMDAGAIPIKNLSSPLFMMEYLSFPLTLGSEIKKRVFISLLIWSLNKNVMFRSLANKLMEHKDTEAPITPLLPFLLC